MFEKLRRKIDEWKIARANKELDRHANYLKSQAKELSRKIVEKNSGEKQKK